MNLDKKLIYAPETYQYTDRALNEEEIEKDPFVQFNKWFKEADDDIPESTTFSTVRLPEGRVSSRIVLLKELDHEGFVIYSNWGTSKKSKDFETCKYASLTFFWKKLQRQVRVEGIMKKVDYEQSNEYFQTRPRGSRIGAWSSPQSQVIENRKVLEDLVKSNTERFGDNEEVKCPEFWGGIKIIPLEIEFWQGRDSRLHDRLTFVREDETQPWKLNRLAP